MSVKTIGEVSFGGGGEDYELPVDAPMSDAENAEYTQLEAVIAEHQQTFVKVGLALLTIRDKKLYRSQFLTFEKYCDTKWGFTARRAYQICAGAEVVENLRVNNCSQFPTHESQARELNKVEPSKRGKVWETAIGRGDTTARGIRSAGAAQQAQESDTGVTEIEVVRPGGGADITVRKHASFTALKKVWQRAGKENRRKLIQWLYDNKDSYSYEWAGVIFNWTADQPEYGSK